MNAPPINEVAPVLLCINAGSSSIKLALFDRKQGAGNVTNALPDARLRASLTGIDGEHPRFQAKNPDGSIVADEAWATGAIDQIMDRLVGWLEQHLGAHELAAVGHRVVHGGRQYSEPVAIDDNVLKDLTALVPLAPLHQPASLAPIRHLRNLRPDLPQIACFDTAFHQGMTPPASRYALPRAFEADGIRRYGFHGLSYEAIAARLRAMDDGAVTERVIVAHLGSGASLCAMQGLCSVDTTMGFSTLDGIMMGTRPGTLDPGILLYLMQTRGFDANRIEKLLYHDSGLLGVSGISPDVEVLLASDRPEAHEALDLFSFLIARQTAALAATLGGIDRFVFTGGIGEHAPVVRRMVADRLAWLGAELAPEANDASRRDISQPGAALKLQVIATDEEAMIACHVEKALCGRK